MKHCAKCGSSRIRRGYSPDPVIFRMVGYRELLCDGCNLRFRGFVIPGTLPRSGRHKKKPETEKSVNVKTTVERTTPVRPREAKVCPNCYGESTHRSHRRGIIENVVSLLSVYPYRCDDCNKRFLVRRRSTKPSSG